MKHLIDSFKSFLNERSKGSYVQNSNITLYHYSSADEKEITLDPSKFGASTYSRRERESSTIPRIFFYVDVAHRETMVSSGRKLYTVNINESILYDLNTDPDGYIGSVRHPVYGLRKGIELDELLAKIKQNYPGMFYTAGNMDVVAWFEPISVERVSDEERAKLEGAK